MALNSGNMDEILKEMLGGGPKKSNRGRLTITPEAAVMRLKELYELEQQVRDNPFQPGQLVMARLGFNSSIVGLPAIVLLVNPNPMPNFSTGDHSSQTWGRLPQMRIAVMMEDEIVRFWVEMAEYALYDEETAKQWRAIEAKGG